MKVNRNSHWTEKVRCKIHLDQGCEGRLVTRMSKLGAVQRGCERAWSVPLTYDYGKTVTIDLAGWPDVLKVEER